jgi:hypothetical protein
MINMNDNTTCANELTEGMLHVVIVLIVGICLLSLALPEGDLDDRDRRGWWPGRR